jgi:hypothetical protein
MLTENQVLHVKHVVEEFEAATILDFDNYVESHLQGLHLGMG